MPRSRAEWDEELAAGMLEDLEEITGIGIGEMMADALEDISPVRESDLDRADEGGEFEVFPVYEEPSESEELDLDNPDGTDTDEYFDVLFDEIDVDMDVEVDQYSED